MIYDTVVQKKCEWLLPKLQMDEKIASPFSSPIVGREPNLPSQ